MTVILVNRLQAKEVENEEINDLKETLQAYGFSSRMIAKAFENIERKDE